MLSVKIEFISGMCVGVEYMSYADLNYEGEGWYATIDLFILRVVLHKEV